MLTAIRRTSTHGTHGTRAARDPRDTLPPNPTGWFAVVESEELPAGAVKALRWFGRDLACFRGEDGVARVVDAHCPHLGAHLAIGGCVKGNAVACPWHDWRFDGEGRCVGIPYAKKIPAGARVRGWETRELNGHVFVWYDESGGAPGFELPRIEACESPEWVRQESRSWIIKAHVQDFAENGVDAAHFLFVHGFEHQPEMSPDIDGPVMQVRSLIRYPAAMGGGEGRLHTRNFGLGFNTTHFTGYVETQLVFVSTPIDDERARLHVTPYLRQLGDPEVMATVGRFFVHEVAHQIESDIPIWENKRMVTRPVLCDGDGPIGPFRRWTRQFYPAVEEAPLNTDAADAAAPGTTSSAEPA